MAWAMWFWGRLNLAEHVLLRMSAVKGFFADQPGMVLIAARLVI